VLKIETVPIEQVRRKTVVIHNNSNNVNSISNRTPAENQSVSPVSSAQVQPSAQAGGSAPAADHATVSVAGTGISQSSGGSDVRMEKVAAVQQALANGTYNIPAEAVASSVVNSMLGKVS
jgi:negative regulator of flagellin synthesis FlgM